MGDKGKGMIPDTKPLYLLIAMYMRSGGHLSDKRYLGQQGQEIRREVLLDNIDEIGAHR